MDPAYITPLTEITDYLLSRKPGPVTIPNIIKVSQYYGFETFNENNRLTIAGKIILIDIDFDLTKEKEEQFTNISISLLIDLVNNSGAQHNHNNFQLNFMQNFESLLFNNFKESDLFKFNNNFKKLSVLDKFSSLKFDLFNLLNQEVNKLSSSIPNFNQIQRNINDNLGYYYPIHVNYEYLNSTLNSDASAHTCYLEINIKETKDIMINDLKCGICIEFTSQDFNGLIVPEIVLLKLGINNYETFELESIPVQFDGFKHLSLMGTKLVNLKQFYLSNLSSLESLIPVLKNWYFINNVILQKLVKADNEALNKNEDDLEDKIISDDQKVVGATTNDQDNTEELSIDDYILVSKKKKRPSKLIEFLLVDNLHLELHITVPNNSHNEADKIELVFNEARCKCDSNTNLADKINKVEDVYRVLDSVI